MISKPGIDLNKSDILFTLTYVCRIHGIFPKLLNFMVELRLLVCVKTVYTFVIPQHVVDQAKNNHMYQYDKY